MINAALILEGGALRNVFTSGVLDVFMEKGMEFSYVIGTSSGSFVGANYIAKRVYHSARSNLMHSNNPNYYGLKQFLLTGCVFNFDYLFDINNPIDGLYPYDEDELKNTRQRFLVSATNCETGEAVYFEKRDFESMKHALRASGSMQLLCKPVLIDGMTCLDGGISDPICVKKAFDDGNEKAVLVLTRDLEFIPDELSPVIRFLYNRVYKKYPRLITAMENAIENYCNLIEEIKVMERENKVFVIRPRREITIKRLEKDVKALADLYFRGREDALSYLPKMLKYLDVSRVEISN